VLGKQNKIRSNSLLWYDQV